MSGLSTTADNGPQLRLLGTLSAYRHGRRIELTNRKAAALLAVLALQPGISRERLADLLWSRSAEAQARGSLRQALAQLRRILDDPGLIETGGDHLRLAAEHITVDVHEFEAALDDGSPAALGRAAELYAGDFLHGFVLNETPFEDWRRVETERLRRRAWQGLERLLQHHAETGDVEAATELGERLLQLDPASEPTYQVLMRLHLERGALGSALREYERCRDALSREFSVPPSAETEALRRRIRARPLPSAAQNPDSPPLVAVLPFANLSDDPTQGYFARGFAEEIIHALTRFRSLRVMAAHSSFAVADPRAPPHETGGRLGARYLLSGSVRRATRSIRIGTELVDAGNGHYLWTNRYAIAPEDLFDAQDDIARAVAATLAVRIDDDLLKRATHKPLDNLAAYDCWLRGLACLRSGTPESLTEARPLFQQAIAIDPGFARAYSGLSLSHFNEWSCVAWECWDESERLAFDYAQQGTVLDDTDHMTHFVLGRILLYRREFERAKQHLDRAEALNPCDADMLAQLALSDAYLGQPERGVQRAALAMRLNPFHDDWYFAFAGATHLLNQDLEQAIDFALKAPQVATDIHAYLASAYTHLGQMESARRHLAAFLRIFQRRITFGREPAPGEPARWLHHVNPFRRPEDAVFLLGGLERAGLLVPDALRRRLEVG